MNPSQLYISDLEADADTDPAAIAAAEVRRWLDMADNTTDKRRISMIVVHCSATPNERKVTAEDIRRWHVKDNGWADIGYHYVIRRDGMIEKGRKDEVAGAHVKGYNSRSVGICLIGNDVFLQEQIRSLKFLVQALKKQYKVADKDVLGHYELDDHKTCPNLTGEGIRELIK